MDDELSWQRVIKFRRVIADYVAARMAENEVLQILYKALEMHLGQSWQQGIYKVHQKYGIKEKEWRALETGQKM